MHIQGTQILCKLTTEDEVLEYTGALTQLYREQAWYLDRLYKWAERVGLDKVKAQIVDDDENRKALYERFLYSQKFAQNDPWRERASENVAAHEFSALEPAE
jgi:nitrite reductase (NADH) large subunit